jgi:hypothetical protein
MLIVTVDGTVTGFGLANPKLRGEREQTRQMLTGQPAPGRDRRRHRHGPVRRGNRGVLHPAGAEPDPPSPQGRG